MLRTLLAFVFLSSLSFAQAVLVVSPTHGYATVDAAIAAAVDGDIILVKEGTYPGFTVNGIGVSIIGEIGAQSKKVGASSISNLSGNGGFVLRNIDIESLDVISCDDPVMLDGDFGRVISPAIVSGTPGTHPTVRITDCASVSIRAYTIEGPDQISPPNEAIALDNSLLMLWNTTAYGRRGPAFTTTPPSSDHGGHGIVITNGATLYAEGALLAGGNGGTYSGSNVASGMDGGSGVVGGTPDFWNCVFGSGFGNFFQKGSPGSAGQPFGADGVDYTGTPNFLTGQTRNYTATSPIREGALCSFSTTGIVGEIWSVIYDSAQIVGSPQLSFGGYFIVDISTATTLATNTIPSGGFKTFQITMPNLPSGVLGVNIFTQSLYYDSGLTYIQIGRPSPVVLLDSIF